MRNRIHTQSLCKQPRKIRWIAMLLHGFFAWAFFGGLALSAQTFNSYRLVVVDGEQERQDLFATAFNDENVVVGTSRLPGEERRFFIWRPLEGIEYLGNANAYGLFGDVNNWEYVVGTNSEPGLWIWKDTLLAQLDVGGNLPAFINDHLQLAGTRSVNGQRRGFIQRMVDSKGGYNLDDIGHLGGGSSEVHAINNQGTVVGCSHNADGEKRAFRFSQQTGMVLLEIPLDSGNYSIAKAVNDDDDILVWNSFESYLVDGETGLVDTIEAPEPAELIRAVSINGRGDAVGSYVVQGSALVRPFIWREGIAVDLNELVSQLPKNVTLVSPVAINENGAILIQGLRDNTIQAFILEPVMRRW